MAGVRRAEVGVASGSDPMETVRLAGEGEAPTTPLPKAGSTPPEPASADNKPDDALAGVERIRALIPGWRRTIAAVIAEGNAATPDWAKLRLLLNGQNQRPGAATVFLPVDAAATLGMHAD